MGYYERLAVALHDLLVEKTLVTADEIRARIELIDSRTPADGARVVARAWVDAEYRKRLLHDPAAAVGELGITIYDGTHLVVMENTPRVHNMVVCTLCSCYPRTVLCLPPDERVKIASDGRRKRDLNLRVLGHRAKSLSTAIRGAEEAIKHAEADPSPAAVNTIACDPGADHDEHGGHPGEDPGSLEACGRAEDSDRGGPPPDRAGADHPGNAEGGDCGGSPVADATAASPDAGQAPG